MRATYAVVNGLVQGVGFRYSTQQAAQRLGIDGWVRNRPDGSVEVWAQGDADAVARMAQFLEQGPRPARVELLRIDEVEPDSTLDRFEVRF